MATFNPATGTPTTKEEALALRDYNLAQKQKKIAPLASTSANVNSAISTLNTKANAAPAAIDYAALGYTGAYALNEGDVVDPTTGSIRRANGNQSAGPYQTFTNASGQSYSNTGGKAAFDAAQQKYQTGVVDSQSAKNDLSKIQTDFQSILNSISNKQQYNQAGLNVTNSVVDLMKSKGIADTSVQARTQLAQQAGISDYNPNNSESNKKLAEAIMNSKAVGSAMSQLTPGTKEYDAALGKVSGTIANTVTPAQPQTPAQTEALTSIGTKVSEDPAMAEYDRITAEIDQNNNNITSALNQLRTGAIPLTADQEAVVNSTQQSFNNAIAQQKQANQTQENIVKQSSFRSGSEYTPEVSSSIIKNVIDANVLKISEYDQQAIATIANLKQSFKEANYKQIKDGYDALQKTLKDKQDNMFALMKLSHDYEKESLNYNLDVLRYQETVRSNMTGESIATLKATSGGSLIGSGGVYANDLDALIGAAVSVIPTKFGQEQFSQQIARSRDDGDKLSLIASQVLKNAPADVRKDFTNQSIALKQLNKAIEELDNGVQTGLLQNTSQYVAGVFGKDYDPKLQKVQSLITSAVQPYRTSITGAAWGAQEDKEYADLFGSTKYSPEALRGRLVNMVDTLKSKSSEGLNVYINPLGTYDNPFDSGYSGGQTSDRLDVQTVADGARAEGQQLLQTGKFKTQEEVEQYVLKAMKDANAYNQSLSNVGSGTNQASKGIVAGYDIKTYATNPKHEVNVASIYSKIPQLSTVTAIDNYIKKVAKNSPVTGQAVAAAAQKYNVDPKMIVAIMIEDSSLGTAGKAVRTKNPGNVGNDDTGALRTYKSWDDGVMAVAKNLAWRKVA
jgi:hypothetical protein